MRDCLKSVVAGILINPPLFQVCANVLGGHPGRRAIDSRTPRSCAKTGGRPAHLYRRDTVDTVFSVKRGGVSWRLLPADFPHWKAVDDDLRPWKKSGLWEGTVDGLQARVREEMAHRVQGLWI
ncbi:transposase [Deinococcus hopiensis]|uniref:transposase n=1 Tax=Deinococcus hopiensis TaxID=309885 RepID=UPI000A01ADBC|nr:transposase [Deinococcus hopiensis]